MDKFCMPDEVNSMEDYQEYLKVIGFNLLHEFFNHKSDANKYLDVTEQEDLEKEFGEWYFQNTL